MNIQLLEPSHATGRPAPGADDGAARASASDREDRRLAALDRLLVLDTPAEPDFDDLVLLASEVCGTPIALISLIDRDRQWFKARIGLEITETPRDIAFCAGAIEAPDALFTVADASADPDFAGNPLVSGEPGIRFYAGMPIVTAGGEALGTICVIDRTPRALTAAQERCLQALARQAAGLIDLRHRAAIAASEAIQQAGVSTEARIRQQHSAQLLDLVLQGRELGLWDLDVPTRRWSANARELEMLGYADGLNQLEGIDWSSLVHPDDRAVTTSTMGPHLRGEAPYYECTHRMRSRDGRWVWVLSRAVVVERNATGAPRRIVGTHLDITESREDRIALERTQHLLEEIARLANIGGWALELQTNAVHWSPEVRRIHEVVPEFVPTLENAIDFYTPEARSIIRTVVEAAIADGTPWDVQVQLVTGRGRRIWVRSLGYVEYEDGVPARLAGAFQDISEFKQAERALADSERRIRLINDHVPALIMHIDSEERYTYVNAHFERVFGIRPEAILGRTLADVCGPDVYGAIAPHVAAALDGRTVDFESIGQARGVSAPYRSHYVPDVNPDRERNGFHALVFDISDQKRAERELDALARIDPLTGLPNRRHFEERFADAMARSRRARGTGALFFLDVDRFKSINDTFGHASGDEVLRQFAKRLAASLRETDFVARYAGDEFVAIVEGVATESQAQALAQKVATAVRAPFVLATTSLSVTASIGFAMLDKDSSLNTLLARADRGLYEAKAAGRDDVRIARRVDDASHA